LSFFKKHRKEVTYKLTRDRISELSKIDIPPNKRNGRKQAVHLKIMRSNLAIMNEDKGEALQGRPKGSSEQKNVVEKWQESHPNGKKADCIRDTGLSKPTVYRWWSVGEAQ
jgi:hypothetical protein